MCVFFLPLYLCFFFCLNYFCCEQPKKNSWTDKFLSSLEVRGQKKFVLILALQALTLYFLFFLLHRKLRMKRTIKVPAISSKLADIPPDDYSWRKYGQKPIKGSPHPRLAPTCSLKLLKTKLLPNPMICT
jgi:hypothetical protein